MVSVTLLLFAWLLIGARPGVQAQALTGQKALPTRADTLRGTITPERAWWDVLHYHLHIAPDLESKTITGTMRLTFGVLSPGQVMQIDLQKPMRIHSAALGADSALTYTQDGNVWYIHLAKAPNPGDTLALTLHYSGKPRVARMPPWDGGWIWRTDRDERPWATVACQGLGASVWYPCKDHQSDEPDLGATIAIEVPPGLKAVANGTLIGTALQANGHTTWTWQVQSPINTYNLVPYIGAYTHWSETWQGEAGPLELSYWVLDYDEQKAHKHFATVPEVLRCLEHWFGPYPFYPDGYKLVQSPHLGMEHQSAIAYGNNFEPGYRGSDLSGSGWGLKWDFIVVHESGHEWYGNNLTTYDLADMWVHESFTSYSETLYIECMYGPDAATDYVVGTRKNIQNDRPVIGPYSVNREGSGDMYYKGANMLHTIRQLFSSTEEFRLMLRDMNSRWRHSIVSSAQVEAFLSKRAGRDLAPIFDQYLRTTLIPVFETAPCEGGTQYRYTNVVPGFNLPLRLGNGTWIHPTAEWQCAQGLTLADCMPDRSFYVKLK